METILCLYDPINQHNMHTSYYFKRCIRIEYKNFSKYSKYYFTIMFVVQTILVPQYSMKRELIVQVRLHKMYRMNNDNE